MKVPCWNREYGRCPESIFNYCTVAELNFNIFAKVPTLRYSYLIFQIYLFIYLNLGFCRSSSFQGQHPQLYKIKEVFALNIFLPFSGNLLPIKFASVTHSQLGTDNYQTRIPIHQFFDLRRVTQPTGSASCCCKAAPNSILGSGTPKWEIN